MPRWITTLTQKIEDWASDKELVYNFAEKYYHDVIEREAVLANINKNDHILCIGGGYCPFSAILLHQMTGAKCTVIDNNINCISKARQVIGRLGYSDDVKVKCQDGGSVGLKFSDYTIVHFALQVCPMENVFSYVEKHAVPGTKLLIRRPKGRLKNLYSKFNTSIVNSLLRSCPLTSHKKARNIGSTLLYIKQESICENVCVG